MLCLSSDRVTCGVPVSALCLILQKQTIHGWRGPCRRRHFARDAYFGVATTENDGVVGRGLGVSVANYNKHRVLRCDGVAART